VDVMLSTGFTEQVRGIFVTLPRDVQAILVSATFTPDVLSIASHFLRNAIEILLPVEEVPLEAIKQFYVDCGKPEHKFGVLCDLFEVCANEDQSILS
jgi:superfamily II DNA/RNA helicase